MQYDKMVEIINSLKYLDAKLSKLVFEEREGKTSISLYKDSTHMTGFVFDDNTQTIGESYIEPAIMALERSVE